MNKLSGRCFLSIITATYNRQEYLQKLFRSLCQQTCLSFEWIICDDGSQDNTMPLLEQMSLKAPFKMRYFHQENRGRHIAINKCVKLADGELIFFLDSDDILTSDAVEWTVRTWGSLSPGDKKRLCGIVAQKMDLRTKKRLAPPLTIDGGEMSFLDAYFKFRRTEENHKILRTDIYREFLSPEVYDGAYFPEIIGNWFPMARKYPALFYNHVIYLHNLDSESIQRTAKPGAPQKQWQNMILAAKMTIENFRDYFKYNPKFFFISAAQYSYYNFRKGIPFRSQMRDLHGIYAKILYLAALPVGLVIYYYRKAKFGRE